MAGTGDLYLGMENNVSKKQRLQNALRANLNTTGFIQWEGGKWLMVFEEGNGNLQKYSLEGYSDEAMQDQAD